MTGDYWKPAGWIINRQSRLSMVSNDTFIGQYYLSLPPFFFPARSCLWRTVPFHFAVDARYFKLRHIDFNAALSRSPNASFARKGRARRRVDRLQPNKLIPFSFVVSFSGDPVERISVMKFISSPRKRHGGDFSFRVALRRRPSFRILSSLGSSRFPSFFSFASSSSLIFV